MKFALKDFRPLWLPGAALLIALVLGWWAVSYSRDHLDEGRRRLATKAGELAEARQRFQRSDEEKATILRYLPAYQALQQQGFVGGERRIEWVEALRAADRKAALDGVQFRIDPQENFRHPEVGDAVAQRLRRSTMRLTLGLTHEGDLLEFLDALSSQNAGVFWVRSCALTALQISDPAPRRANLTAECEIDWLTVAPPQAPTT